MAGIVLMTEHPINKIGLRWVEFNLIDTSTIEMEMTWALREFNRSLLGFDDEPNIAAAIASMGFSGKDGAPADLIRNFFDDRTGGRELRQSKRS